MIKDVSKKTELEIMMFLLSKEFDIHQKIDGYECLKNAFEEVIGRETRYFEQWPGQLSDESLKPAPYIRLVKDHITGAGELIMNGEVKRNFITVSEQ